MVWTTPNLSSVNDAATKWDRPRGEKKKQVKSESKLGKSTCNTSIWGWINILNVSLNKKGSNRIEKEAKGMEKVLNCNSLK